MKNPNLESDHSLVSKKEEEVFSHKEAPKDIVELQALLMEALYDKDHQNEEKGPDDNYRNREYRNKLAQYWIDSGYSHWFRQLIFDKEKRGEDPMSIKLDEITEFRAGRK